MLARARCEKAQNSRTPGARQTRAGFEWPASDRPATCDVRRPTFDDRDVGGRTSNVEDADILADILGGDFAERFDRFELAQLREVVAACRESRSAAEAGKKLFAVSRQAKKTSNDTDRLAKYLAKFGLSFKAVSGP